MSEAALGADQGLISIRHDPEVESFRGYTNWICEKWSEEAVAFARRKLYAEDDQNLSSALLRKVVGKAEQVDEIPGNLLLNEGIDRLLDKLIGVAGTVYDNTNAYIGVGDTSTAPSASQTELQATQNASNRFYKAMNVSYPSRSGETVSWQSDFATSEANFAWNEWTITAGATTASGSGFLVGTTNLNRKVSALGTKTSGTWTLTGQVTIS